jgi:hypothetical protein
MVEWLLEDKGERRQVEKIDGGGGEEIEGVVEM